MSAAEMERLNVEALAALTTQHKVQLKAFPKDVVMAARGLRRDVLGEMAGRSAVARRGHDSYVAFRERVGMWSRISMQAVLEGREG